MTDETKYHVVCAIDKTDYRHTPAESNEPQLWTTSLDTKSDAMRFIKNVDNEWGGDPEKSRVHDCTVIKGIKINFE